MPARLLRLIYNLQLRLPMEPLARLVTLTQGHFGWGLRLWVTTGMIPGNGTIDIYEIVGTVRTAQLRYVTLQWAQNTSNGSNL